MDDSACELAWRLHTLQETSIARVDVKASIMLTLEGLLLAAVAAGQTWSRDAGEDTWIRALSLSGFALLTLGMLFAGAAVQPVIGSARRTRTEREDHTIYFGHLRHWTAETLAARLPSLDDERQVLMLSREIVTAARLTWRKLRLLQVSVAVTLLGLLLTVGGFAGIE